LVGVLYFERAKNATFDSVARFEDEGFADVTE
jgi:hypothetical protein